MLALGGQGILVDRVSESMWPDSDGDRAQSSLNINLKRLRDDLGSELGHQAVILQGGRLSLDPTMVWCDAVEFNEAAEYVIRNLEREGDEGEAWKRLDNALALYQGPFLDGEMFPPEVMTTREKLHQKFISLVESAATFCEESRQQAQAISLYQRGLEVDDVYEEFYTSLIRCLMEQGRTTEALAVYQRCRTSLQAGYGIEPSEKIEALHQALLADAAQRASNPPPPQPSAPEAQASGPESSPPTLAPDAEPAGMAEEGVAQPAPPPAPEIPAVYMRGHWGSLPGLLLNRWTLLGILAVVLVALAWGGWQGYRVMVLNPVALERLKEESAFPLPEKPSIAVLPFERLGDDPNQQLFADAFTENVIAQLAKVPGLFVISSIAVSVYKGRNVRVQQVGRELGVAKVMSGKVAMVKERARITVSLADAATGENLWSGVYDRPLEDTLQLLDEITHRIVTSLNVVLKEGEQARIWQEAAHDYRAWEYAYQGLSFIRKLEQGDNLKAKEMFMKSLEIDPNYAPGLAGLGYTHFADVRFGWSKDPKKSIAQAMELAKRGIEADDSLAEPYALLGSMFLVMRDFDKAVYFGQQAVERQPNGAEVHALLGQTYNLINQPREALLAINKAIRLSPHHPAYYDFHQGMAYYLLGQYQAAIPILTRYLLSHSDSTDSPVLLISSYLAIGNRREAKRLADLLRSNQPKLTPSIVVNLMPLKDKAVRDRLLRDLHSVGL